MASTFNNISADDARDKVYLDYVASIAALHPNVAGYDPRNKAAPFEKRPATVTMLALENDLKPKEQHFGNASDLRNHFSQRKALSDGTPEGGNTPKMRIYILEGLNDGFVPVLGGFFSIDPSFFAEHEVISRWNEQHSGPRLTEHLPSLLSHRPYFYLPYYELLHSKNDIKEFQYNCGKTGRHISITRMEGKYLNEVLVRRKCSFWSAGMRTVDGMVCSSYLYFSLKLAFRI